VKRHVDASNASSRVAISRARPKAMLRWLSEWIDQMAHVADQDIAQALRGLVSLLTARKAGRGVNNGFIAIKNETDEFVVHVLGCDSQHFGFPLAGKRNAFLMP
jgi:hypothetical protein